MKTVFKKGGKQKYLNFNQSYTTRKKRVSFLTGLGNTETMRIFEELLSGLAWNA